MNLTPTYIKECESVIRAGFAAKDKWRKNKIVQDRLKIIYDFCKGHDSILSVGCGPLEPIEIKATHALDVSDLAHKYLIKQGWKGLFCVGSCDNIPKMGQDFDVAVCSEVIEHLPDKPTIRKTFLELNRVARRWIVTTPAVKGGDPTHKRLLDFAMLEALTCGLKCKIQRKGNYWFIFYDGK